MMDLKEIIKWFIPCFHILLTKMNAKLIIICLFLFFNFASAQSLNLSASDSVGAKKLVNLVHNEDFNQSLSFNGEKEGREYSSVGRTFHGRTFGPRIKKMIGALMPIIFQLGAASTWAVVAALVGVKTLMVTLLILKILLVAGAAKLGALFATKSHHGHHQEWTPPQKEIHLHIHNKPGHEIEEHEHHVPVSSWSRNGAYQGQNVNYVVDPYPYRAGPQTISTPFGNYVKIDPAPTSSYVA